MLVTIIKLGHETRLDPVALISFVSIGEYIIYDHMLTSLTGPEIVTISIW